jgi:hypothetical protein
MDLLARLNQAYTSDSDEGSSQPSLKQKIEPIKDTLKINPAPEVDISDLVAD